MKTVSVSVINSPILYATLIFCFVGTALSIRLSSDCVRASFITIWIWKEIEQRGSHR